jgi:catechol 2,3-dioxygenase-like lactoylglutathione lyase family enzyme
VIDINGMAHLVITVNKWEEATAFYKKLLPEMGMKEVFNGDDFCYHVGARTAIGINRAAAEHADARFDQTRVGLHHFCLRARSREDIERTAEVVKEAGGKIVRGPMEGAWAPGYYYVLFEDPDGLRFEVNFVPGQGVLKEGLGQIDDGGDYR